MADTWGGSWGSAWGVSWGGGVAPAVTTNSGIARLRNVARNERRPFTLSRDALAELQRQSERPPLPPLIPAAVPSRPAIKRPSTAVSPAAVQVARESGVVAAFEAARIAKAARVAEAARFSERAALERLDLVEAIATADRAARWREDDEIAAMLLLL